MHGRTEEGRGPRSEERTGAPARQQFDIFAHQQEAREGRSLRSLPTLALSALGLVRRASPRLFAVVSAAQLAQALLLLVQVLLAKEALEAVLAADRDGGTLREVLPPFVGLVGAAAATTLAAAVVTHGQRLLGELVQRDALAQVLDVTTAVDLETFESPEFFDDLQRVRADALLQPQALASGLVGVVGGLLGVLGLSVALLAIEPLLVGVLLAAGLPLWLTTRRAGREEYAFKFAQTPAGRLRLYLVDLMCGREQAKELRAFGLRDVLTRRWEESYVEYVAALRRHVRRRLSLALAGAVATAVVTSAAFGLLVWMVLDDRLGLAEAGAAVLGIRLIAMRVEQVLNGTGKLLESSLLLRDLDRFLTRAPAGGPAGAPSDVAPFAELVLDDVRFAYPGTGTEAVAGVTMRLRAGEVVALVGDNGSGKTTLAKLVAGLFRPTAGRVVWDGVDLRHIDPRAVWRHVGIVFQDFVRYELTARENIGFGRTEALGDLEAIRDAAERAGAHDAVERLPQGYETVLGRLFRGGHDLSLGQWQRVALARAFFRDAHLLVLDEPTASLDARSEHDVFRRVQQLSQGRAVLLISHRFSTVRSADRIYVLHHGRLVEEGTHDELMAAGGRYAEMFSLQAAAYG